ncbi:hypothetical protein DL96DRAFT_1817310 [Flagelloscypha sp. PMI_526]|nr:hypothetical protein DL96DRAFT_1817310 [Flagelloscypha sp. PMI_526]
MSTPIAGTVQARLEVESQIPPRQPRLSYTRRFAQKLHENQDYLVAIPVLSAALAGIHAVYMVLATLFGRTILLRHRKFSQLLHRDGSASTKGECITAAIAGAIAVPGCWLLFLLVAQLKKRFRNIGDYFLLFGVIGILVNGLASIAASGAAMHARFDFINPPMMMEMFGIGTLAFAACCSAIILAILLLAVCWGYLVKM